MCILARRRISFELSRKVTVELTERCRAGFGESDIPRPFRRKGRGFYGPAAFVVASRTLVGVALYAYGVSTFADDTSLYSWKYVKAGIWPFVYIVAMLILTYIGSSNFGAPHQLIPYPWDVLVVAIVALAFYYWGVASGIPTIESEDKLREFAAAGKTASAD